MPKLDINTDAVVEMTTKLEKMSRSAFPVSVRQSLNSAAFDHRNTTMPAKYKATFLVRNKSTLRAFSRVKTAQGFDVNRMMSVSGVIDGDRSWTDDVEKQEYGGSVKKRMIPFKDARVGKSESKLVFSRNRLKALGRLSPTGVRKGDKKNLIKAAHSVGKGGVVKYGDVQYRVASLAKGKFKMFPLYADKPGRMISLKKRSFIRPAALVSGKKIERIFINTARKRLSKI